MVQRSGLTWLPTESLPCQKSSYCGVYVCGGERREVAGDSLPQEDAMQHHGIPSLDTAKHLSFLSCIISVGENLLFLLIA